MRPPQKLSFKELFGEHLTDEKRAQIYFLEEAYKNKLPTTADVKNYFEVAVTMPHEEARAISAKLPEPSILLQIIREEKNKIHEGKLTILQPMKTREDALQERKRKTIFLTSAAIEITHDKQVTENSETLRTPHPSPLNLNCDPDDEVIDITPQQYKPEIMMITPPVMSESTKDRFVPINRSTDPQQLAEIASLYEKVAQGFHITYCTTDINLMTNVDFMRLRDFCRWAQKVGLDSAAMLLQTAFTIVTQSSDITAIGGCPEITPAEKEAFISGNGKNYAMATSHTLR